LKLFASISFGGFGFESCLLNLGIGSSFFSICGRKKVGGVLMSERGCEE
jgi:hypothetical protein